MVKLACASHRIIHLIATKATAPDNSATKAASMPRATSPVSAISSPFNRPAPAMTGRDSNKENRAALTRSNPNQRAAVMVTPDRDAPGINAPICASPMTTAAPKRISVNVLPNAPCRSLAHSKPANTKLAMASVRISNSHAGSNLFTP